MAEHAHEAADYNVCRPAHWAKLPFPLLSRWIMPDDHRLDNLRRWLVELGAFDPHNVVPASADASFRRYFRVRRMDGTTCIVMDAPPEQEDLAGYLRVSQLLEQCGMHVPHVFAADTAQGYAVLEDLGSTHMLTALGSGMPATQLYDDALDALAHLQLGGGGGAQQLPPYDRATLLREMQLLPDWYCRHHLQFEPDASGQQTLHETFELLVSEALLQPQVFVHRDYHSRNLMITPQRSPGVIDFQDALHGPVCYDLASILKDCYIDWPRAQVEAWVAAYRDRLLAGGAQGRALAGESLAQFLRWFDLIGLQRHIKVLGIFARLCWRDGKTGYLADLPRTLGYVQAVARAMPELARFAEFVEQQLAPGLVAANARALAAART
jgi:aminoglycoside/choline kinase family phosphotransferase